MKLHAVIVLLAIALSIVLPPSLPVLSAHGGQASIGVLDVCHSATPALSSGGEMPCVSERPCRLPSLEQSRIPVMINPSCKPVLIAYQKEQPPKV
ncbi:MAG TPA: hypothetical protein VF905_13995 [Nitrospirota bacterium]